MPAETKPPDATANRPYRPAPRTTTGAPTRRQPPTAAHTRPLSPTGPRTGNAPTTTAPTGNIPPSGQAGATTEISSAELVEAVRTAWDATDAGANLYWRGLRVQDYRAVDHPDAIAYVLASHLRSATTTRQPLITVLHPVLDILNDQLLSYAGYRQADGSVLGDPRQTTLTDLALRNGWPGGRATHQGRAPRTGFDPLPIALRLGPGPAIAYQLPPDRIDEIPITHPQHPWLAEQGLRWYATSATTTYRLHLTDTQSWPVVISGWPSAAEIACRALAAADRYHLLPALAHSLGLTDTDPTRLDTAELVLHQAVLHSYARTGIAVTEHHRGQEPLALPLRPGDAGHRGRDFPARPTPSASPPSGSPLLSTAALPLPALRPRHDRTALRTGG